MGVGHGQSTSIYSTFHYGRAVIFTPIFFPIGSNPRLRSNRLRHPLPVAWRVAAVAFEYPAVAAHSVATSQTSSAPTFAPVRQGARHYDAAERFLPARAVLQPAQLLAKLVRIPRSPKHYLWLARSREPLHYPPPEALLLQMLERQFYYQ